MPFGCLSDSYCVTIRKPVFVWTTPCVVLILLPLRPRLSSPQHSHLTGRRMTVICRLSSVGCLLPSVFCPSLRLRLCLCLFSFACRPSWRPTHLTRIEAAPWPLTVSTTHMFVLAWFPCQAEKQKDGTLASSRLADLLILLHNLHQHPLLVRDMRDKRFAPSCFATRRHIISLLRVICPPSPTFPVNSVLSLCCPSTPLPPLPLPLLHPSPPPLLHLPHTIFPRRPAKLLPPARRWRPLWRTPNGDAGATP